MGTSIGSFAGIGSGFDYRDLVDQLIQIQSQPMTVMQSRIDVANAKLTAYKTFRSLIATLDTAATQLRDGSAFNATSTNITNGKSTTGATILSATSVAGTAPGSYAVQVLQTATAEKLSGAELDGTAALGLSGDFRLNGKTITVAATDTLSAIRDKINLANTGTTPTGVSASIVSNGTTQRLVLTSQKTGSAGINLVDGAQGIAQQLGWVDATATIKHTTSSGAQSDAFTSSSEAIATQLGLTVTPGPQTVTIGGQSLTIDLSTDSLDSIAAAINGLTGVTASVQSTTANGKTTYSLDIRNTTSFVDAGNTLEQLGILQLGRSSIAQQLTSGALTAGDASTPATTSTLLTQLWTNGTAGNAQAGDTITIAGTRGDGSAVSVEFTIQAGSTVQDLLNALNDATTGFGAGTRPATASLDANGRIVLTDNAMGASALSLQLITHNENGGQLDFGAIGVTTTGRSRELVAGTDAKYTVDGVFYTSASNTVSNVIAGTTLTLSNADPATTVTVTVDRNASMTQSALQSYVDAYNKVIDFIQQQSTATPGAAQQPALYNDPLLRTARSALPTAMLSTVTGAATDMATAGSIGLSLTKDGHLSLDANKFNLAFTTRYDDLQKIFMERGSTSDSSLQYVLSSPATRSGTYAVEITQAATKATVASTGFSGVFNTANAEETFTVTDRSKNATVTISLTDGMTTEAIIDALNTAFETGTSKPLGLVASANGNEIVITHTGYGSAYGIEIGLTGDGTDPLAQLGLSVGTVNGTDVQGTIDGVAAVGAGQSLVGATGSAAAGLSVLYTGDTTGPMGTVTLALGVGAMIDRLLTAWNDAQTGLITSKENALNASITRDQKRIEDFSARMEIRRAALLKQYLAMDTAVNRITSQGNAFLTAITQAANNKSNN